MHSLQRVNPEPRKRAMVGLLEAFISESLPQRVLHQLRKLPIAEQTEGVALALSPAAAGALFRDEGLPDLVRFHLRCLRRRSGERRDPLVSAAGALSDQSEFTRSIRNEVVLSVAGIAVACPFDRRGELLPELVLLKAAFDEFSVEDFRLRGWFDHGNRRFNEIVDE
jgi:hypothetical protein